MPTSIDLNKVIVNHPRPVSSLLLALLCWSASRSLAVEVPAAMAITLDHGSPRIAINGSVGQWVQLQYRSALQKPSVWHALTNVLLSAESMSFVDASATPGEPRFYQATAAAQSPVDPSTFLMGSALSEDGRDSDEGPETEATLTSYFWIGQHEVTQREYLAVMGSNPSAAIGDLDRPVEQVSWTEAQSYCAKLTELEQSTGLISAGFRYRLPTEAEWEYASRAGATNRFNFGDDPAYALLGNYGWFADNSNSTTHPVDTKQPNSWGLYDMTGNVWEWCQDYYGPYLGGSQTNPTGPAAGSERVVRGGSYYYDGWLCRSAARNSLRPTARSSQVGFRVVLIPN